MSIEDMNLAKIDNIIMNGGEMDRLRFLLRRVIE